MANQESKKTILVLDDEHALLAKPFTTAELQAKIRQVLRAPAVTRAGA